MQRWREEGEKDTDSFCEQIASLDKKVLETLDEAQKSESKFFAEELKKDKATGHTPARRVERDYPRKVRKKMLNG